MTIVHNLKELQASSPIKAFKPKHKIHYPVIASWEMRDRGIAGDYWVGEYYNIPKELTPEQFLEILKTKPNPL